jgi:hypothetical protein
MQTLMKKKVLLILLVIISASQKYLFAQKKTEIKFGKVMANDFVINSPVVDSNANAVVLADFGSSEFEGNNKGGFSVVYKRIKRIKIINKNAFNVANVGISLHTYGNNEDALEDCKGITYNLNDGVVTQTKLDTKSIFKEQTFPGVILKKFTMPDVKEGSIIEYTYAIKSDNYSFSLWPWHFQEQYTCLRSEYTIAVPQFFDYVFLSTGYVPIKTEKKTYTQSFNIGTSIYGTLPSSFASLSGVVYETSWTATDVPAIIQEPFTTNLQNHISKIEFQLSRINFPNRTEDIMSNWVKVSEKLMQDEHFGASLNKNNGWMDDELKQITNGAQNLKESAQKIYSFLRDNFTRTSLGMIQMGKETSLKDIFKKRSGSVAEINLLLTAMLKHINIDANPVLLSTRSHGVANPVYPLLNKLNYVICAATIDTSLIFLDASMPKLGFGKLPIDCYNGVARVITENPQPVWFSTDSLLENNLTIVNVYNDSLQGMIGTYNSNLGYYESFALRNRLSKTTQDAYFAGVARDYPFGIRLSDKSIDSLTLYETPVSVSYKMKFSLGDEDIIYFNPLFNHAIKENPFKAAERHYPVEMPYIKKGIFVFSMEVPKGYKVDEMPKSIRVRLNDNDGMFEYLTNYDATNNQIQMRCTLALSKANYNAEDYQTLRDFYSAVVKKEAEQIVLKKIK